MSSSIWTQCGASSNLRPLLQKPWRVVLAQQLFATRKLVESVLELDVLEALLDESERRPWPRAPQQRKLHPLLVTPFRVPPLTYGSRFGRRFERGLWYGSTKERTAFAEVAYYRLLFLAGTTAELPPLMVELTAFRVPVYTARGIDLVRSPFADFVDELASRTAYVATQALGSAMRADGVEAFCYVSARDVAGGTNIALFAPRAFAASRPVDLRDWLSVATPAGVELSRKHLVDQGRFYFPRQDFEVDGRLPAPAA